MNTKDSKETSSSTTAPTAANATPAAPAGASSGRARRLGLFGLGAVVLLGGLLYAGYWFFDARYFESTDDGYVNGDVVQVTSEVPGTVLSLNVDDTQLVEAGQPLLTLDQLRKSLRRMPRPTWRVPCAKCAGCSPRGRNYGRRSSSVNKPRGLPTMICSAAAA